MILGKSIRVYLKDGSVTGIKFAELVNQTIQALSCPRNKLSDLNKYFSDEINTQGIYFLIGYEENTLNPRVYVGEAENVWDRLKNHDLKKDFWNEVILFTSKDDNLTKSHIKYLESRAVEVVRNVARYSLENGNTPNMSSLPLPDKDAMEEFLTHIKLLTGTLGHKFLEDPISIRNIPEIIEDTIAVESNGLSNTLQGVEFTLNRANIVAKAILTNEGLVVLQNSSAVANTNANYGYKGLRDKLIADDILQRTDDGNLIFTKNYLFSSPSAAAGVIVGYSINGRDAWKNGGNSMNDIEKTELE